MKDAKSLFPQAGQTALLWINDKVVLKRDYKEASVIYTRFDSFIGTKEEVETKIDELGLKEPKAPEIPNISKPPVNPMQATEGTKPAGVISNTVNFVKSIFGN